MFYMNLSNFRIIHIGGMGQGSFTPVPVLTISYNQA